MFRSKLSSRFLTPSSLNFKPPVRPLLRVRILSTLEEGSSQLSPGTKAYLEREGRDADTQSQPHLDTLLSHAGLSSTSSHTKSSFNEPVTPPLHLSTTFTRPPGGDYFNEEQGGQGYIYSRMNNPTRDLLEKTISSLELAATTGRAGAGVGVGVGAGGFTRTTEEDCDEDTEESSAMTAATATATTCAFSSGMAAVSSLLLALSSQTQQPLPLHVIVPTDVYHGVPTVLSSVLTNQLGISSSAVDMTSLQGIQLELERILKLEEKKKCNILIWMESPSNPQCQVVDIEQVSQYVGAVRDALTQSGAGDSEGIDIVTAVDSTWSPPTITKPLMLGADVVVHSGTKYLGGHSDVLLGTVTTSPFTSMGHKLGPIIRTVQVSMGAVASPMDCWLTLRGLRTLHVRVERQCDSAMQLARYLENHKHVKRVYYPGTAKDASQFEIASRQMAHGMFGGMLSFEMDNEAMAMAVAGALRIIQRATSLGGTETLIEHRASMEPEDRKVSPEGLLRVSVGLEHVEDLKQDLEIAIKIACSIKEKRSNCEREE